MSMGNVNEGRNELGQFVQGRQETAEEKIKRIKAAQEAWKSRKDYIGEKNVLKYIIVGEL